MKTYKALGALLLYPEPELVAAVPELEACLDAEGLLPGRRRRAIAPLLERLRTTDLLELQADYVRLVDQWLGLELLEHLLGPCPQRGRAAAELAEAYGGRGFELCTAEPPDHLPVFCEFLSLLPDREARRFLARAAPAVEALAARHGACESPYAAVFAALSCLSTPRAGRREVAEVLARMPSTPAGAREP